MKIIISIFFILLSIATAQALELNCGTIELPARVPGPNFVFSTEKIFTVDSQGRQKIYFDPDTTCGKKNDLFGSLIHSFTDLSNGSDFEFEFEGKSVVKISNPETGTIEQTREVGRALLVFNKKATNSKLGSFSCGLHGSGTRLLLKDCVSKP